MIAISTVLLMMAANADPTAVASGKGAEAPEVKRVERKVCRQTTVLGSRVAQNVTCGTKAEWAIRERESQHFLSKSQEGTFVPDAGPR